MVGSSYLEVFKICVDVYGLCTWLIMVVMGWLLDLMILEAFSNLPDSMTLSKKWHVCASRRLSGLAWHWLLPEGQVPALPKLHVPPGTTFIPQLQWGNEQCQTDKKSWAWGWAGTPHPQVSPALLQLFTQQILLFQPRLEHWEEGRAEHSGFCLFLSHQGQRDSCSLRMWLGFFFLLLNIFMLFFFSQRF